MTMKNKDISSRRKIAIGTIFNAIAVIASLASGIFFTPLIKQSVGVSTYGLYTLALSVINLLLLDFGLSNSTTALVSKFKSRNDEDSEARVINVTFKLYLALDLVILVLFSVFAIASDYVFVGLTSSEQAIARNLFLILAGFSLVSFPSSVFTGVIQAYEDFAFLKIIDLTNSLVYIALTSLSLVFGLGIYAIVVAAAMRGLIGAIAKLLYFKLKLGKKICLKEKNSFDEYKKVLGFSSYNFIISIASRLILTIVPTILGIVSDSTNIAVFGICYSLNNYFFTFGSLMSDFFTPKAVSILETEDPGKASSHLQEIGTKAGKIQFAIFTLIFIGFVCCGQEFISLWMLGDNTFQLAYFGTLLLTIYDFIYLPQSVFRSAMTANKTLIKPFALWELSLALINVCLVFLLGYFYGAIGACISVFSVRVIALIGYNYFFKKKLGIRIFPFFKDTFLKFIPMIVLMLAVGLTEHYFLPFGTLPKFLIIGFSVVLVFLSTVWFGLGKETIKEIVNIFKKRRC